MAETTIGWTDVTWNPVTGCEKVSPGCDHCYAERITERFHGPGSFAEVKLHPERLDAPLRWRKPRRVFVNSMSDLFHQDVPDEFIAHVWTIMALTPQHNYQILTKRHGRMRSLLSSERWGEKLVPAALRWVLDNVPGPLPAARFDAANRWVMCRERRDEVQPPLSNVWLGVSVEDQKRADLRIPALLDTPAVVRFLSCEPLLGPVDLRWPGAIPELLSPFSKHRGVDWVICGGESGPGARPMELDWARSLVEQCRDAGVACFVKQDSGPRPGMQGRIPDDLWVKEFPVVSR